MTKTILNLCLTACLLFVASAQTDSVTEDPGFHLNPSVKDRRTDSMVLVWQEPHGGVLAYQIHFSKSDSEDQVTSPNIDSALTEYNIENLIVESEYHICLKAATNDVVQESEGLVFNEQECIMANTVDVIRRDSIIAIIIALGYIFAMILLGYICWRIAKYRIDSRRDAREEELLAEEEAEPEAEEEKAQVKVTPPTPPVKRVTQGIPRTPQPVRPKTPEPSTPEPHTPEPSVSEEPPVTLALVNEVESAQPKPDNSEPQSSPAEGPNTDEPKPETLEPNSEPQAQVPEPAKPDPSEWDVGMPPKSSTPEPSPAPRPLLAKPPRTPTPPMTASAPKSEPHDIRRLPARAKLAPLASMEESMDDLMRLVEP